MDFPSGRFPKHHAVPLDPGNRADADGVARGDHSAIDDSESSRTSDHDAVNRRNRRSLLARDWAPTDGCAMHDVLRASGRGLDLARGFCQFKRG